MSEPGPAGHTPAVHRPALTVKSAAAVWAVIVVTSLGSLWFFYSRGLSNIYGDGLAHMEGARRLFDSLTPGLAAVGSVWLPLQHFLIAPLAINNTLWRTGLAGSFVSLAAFVLTTAVLFRLALEMNSSVAAACVTLAFFLISLNMLYAASTPLTEPLAIFWAALVAYALFRFQQSGCTSTCVWAAIAAFCGTLTRYDGWYLLPFAFLFVLLCRRRNWKDRFGQALLFGLIASAGPLLWFWHNARRYGNAFQFYDGPYSAKGIYLHQIAATGYHYPTAGSLWISAHYYLEAMKLVFGPWTLIFAALGFVAWIVDRDLRARRSAALLLLVPFLFYTQSMAFSSVAIYVPTLPPYTYYNLRYGLEMAPALAVFPGFLIPSRPLRVRGLTSYAIPAALCVILLLQAVGMAWPGVKGVAMAEESVLNTPCRTEAEQAAIRFFKSHYNGEPLLIDAGIWPCLMPSLGIPYRKTLSRSNRPYWREVRFGASRWVGWIVRRSGDAVDNLMRAYPAAFKDFELVERDELPQHEILRIYRRRQ